MKVPTYTSQSLQTAKTGAGSFSVQASPANTAMGFAAQGEFLSQLQGTSLKFLEAETKLQRQTELSQAENALDFEMQNLTMAALNNTNPTSMMDNWNRGTAKLYSNISMKIDDPVVRRAFVSKAKDTILTKRLSVMKTARARRIENAKAVSETEIYNTKRKIATGSPSEREAAKLKLFGREATVDDFGNPVPKVPSIYERMFNNGLISATEKVTQELDAMGDIENMEIAQDMTAARVSGNPAHVERIIGNLDNPAMYPNLFGEERDGLMSKAISLRDSLRQDRITKEKQKIELDKKIKTAKQISHFDDLNLQLDKSKVAASEVQPPSLEQIRNDYESDKLNSTQYKTLKEKIISGDVPKSNSIVVKDFITQINSAPDDATLDIIKQDIINTADTLTTASYQNLIGQIDQRKGNTPRALEIDKERKILAKILGLSGGDLEEAAALRTASIDAITTFEELVAKNIDSDPKKIRKYLVDNYRSNILHEPDFPHLALTPNVMREAYKLWDDQNKRINDAVVEDLEKKIRDNPDLSPNMKAEEVRTLKHYIEYLKRTNADIEVD
jgi:hypothetical protein